MLYVSMGAFSWKFHAPTSSVFLLFVVIRMNTCTEYNMTLGLKVPTVYIEKGRGKGKMIRKKLNIEM